MGTTRGYQTGLKNDGFGDAPARNHDRRLCGPEDACLERAWGPALWA